MSICNDKHHDKPSSCRQIFVHVRESETPMRDVRNLLLDTLMQYREADKIGLALGVLDKSASFSDAVSWCAILGKMDHDKDSLDRTSKQHLGYAVDYLEELVKGFHDNVVMQIQKYRDKWMRRVLAWDVVVFTFLLLLGWAGIYWSGISVSTDAMAPFFKQRPLFSALSVLTGIGIIVGVHFVIRRQVLNHLLEKMEVKLLPGMSLNRALIKNARKRHSIFRPYPVGWNFTQRKRLNAITEQLESLREALSEVLASYPDQKAA